MNRWLLCCSVLVALLSQSSPLWAQRYLSEFVGSCTLQSSATTARVTNVLSFTELDNRRVAGSLALVNPLTLGFDQLDVSGTLANSGNCNVQLRSSTLTGALNLIEIPFDAMSFALIGRVSISDGTSNTRASGGYSGGIAVVRPVANPVIIRSSNIGSMMLQSKASGITFFHSLAIARINPSPAIMGGVVGSGPLQGFSFTLSASPSWTYMVGENGTSFVAFRAQSQLNLAGELEGFHGEYMVFNASGKVLDSGFVFAD